MGAGSARRRGCGDERGGWGGHREGGGGAAHTDRGKREAGEGRKGERARLGVAVATAGGHVAEEWPPVRDRGGGEGGRSRLCARARECARTWRGRGVSCRPPLRISPTRGCGKGRDWLGNRPHALDWEHSLHLICSNRGRLDGKKEVAAKSDAGVGLPTPSRFGGAPPFAVSDMPRGLTQDHQRLALPAEGGSRGPLGPPPSAPGPIDIILFYTVTPPRRDASDQGAGARFGSLQKLLASPTRWLFRGRAWPRRKKSDDSDTLGTREKFLRCWGHLEKTQQVHRIYYTNVDVGG